MIGIIFLALVGAYFWFAGWAAKRLTKGIALDSLRRTSAVLAFAALLVAPLLDEIIGGRQLRALCEKDKIFKVKTDAIRGKTLFAKVDPSNQELEGTAVRILYSRSIYRDATTNEELAITERIVADGGLLIQMLSASRRMSPLTFESTCDGSLGLGVYKVKVIQ